MVAKKSSFMTASYAGAGRPDIMMAAESEIVRRGSHQMLEIAVVNATSSPAATPEGAGFSPSVWGVAAVAWLLLVVAVGRVMKLFRTDSIVGPERLAHDESGWLLIVNACTGILAVYGILMSCGPAVAHLSAEERTVVLGAIANVTAVVVLLVMSRFLRGDRTARIGLNPSKMGIGFVGGVTALMIIDPVVMVAGVGVEEIFRRFHLPLQPHEMLTLMEQTRTPWVRRGGIVTACLLAPFAEELVFRGMLQTALAQGFAILFNPSQRLTLTGTPPASRWAAVIVASLAFAAIHQSMAFFIPLFVLSVGFGYLYERTGNLWATITAHGLFNLTNTLLFLYSAGST
jgi:membrane protease YdiL (CAAX protease family)